jgi:hypothetical protein
MIGIPLLPARLLSQAALTRCLAALGGLAVAHLRSVVTVKPFQPWLLSGNVSPCTALGML